MYGLGMKTAAASLGRVWEIWTRHADSSNDFYARFDLEEFKTRWSRSQKDLWKIDLVTLERATGSPLGNRKTGTVIKVTQVRDENPDVGVVEGHIGASYRVEVKKFKDMIYLNNRKIDVADPMIVEGTRVDLDFEVSVRGKKHRVKGWWGRLPTYHNDGEYGFDLYRQGQLISGHLKEPLFTAHNTVSNLYATLELPFIQANYHKKGFDYGCEEWKALEETMKDDIMPGIIKVVRQWKAKDLKGTQQGGGALGGARVAVGTGPTSVVPPIKLVQTPATVPQKGQPSSPVSIAKGDLDWKMIQFNQLPPFLLTFELIPMNSEITPWSYVAPASDQTLLVKINVDSVLYKKSKDSNSFAMFAVADCVCQYLTEFCKQEPKQVRILRNEWLNRAASSKFSDIVKQTINK
jgi:hypothetical protein